LVLDDVGEARVQSDDPDTTPRKPGLEVESEAATLSDVCEVRECEAEVPSDAAGTIVYQTLEAVTKARNLRNALSLRIPILLPQRASTPKHPTNCSLRPTLETRIAYDKRMSKTRLH